MVLGDLLNPVFLDYLQYLEGLLRPAFLRCLGVQLHRRDLEFQDFLLNLVFLDYFAARLHLVILNVLADPLRQLIRDCLLRLVARLHQELP